MAKTSTNDRKRAEMAAIMERLLTSGWTPVRISAYFAYSSSAVGSWKRGKSMGTNDQRAALSTLPDADDPAVVEKLREMQGGRQFDVDQRKARIAGLGTEEAVVEKCAQIRASHQRTIELEHRHIAEMDRGIRQVTKWTNQVRSRERIADYEAKLTDSAATEAQARKQLADGVKWETKQLRGDTKMLKEATSAVASYEVSA